MPKQSKQIETLRHGEAKRPNIPTAEYEPVVDEGLKTPILVAYERRNPDLDPQLVWRGKDLRDWSDLVVPAPPLYIQEKVHPKVLVDDLLRRSRERAQAGVPQQLDLFADFNGIPEGATGTDFYRHDANWSNRLILGDSLQVMASLAEREGLRGRVQCIYLDPPYGIKFNSNFQWSTTSRDVKDGRADNITRKPEQVRAFRDTWRDGIHSYLTYLRDRLTVARDLLAESGSVFVQIGDENAHRVRALMDEVFGVKNFAADIIFRKTSGQASALLPGIYDHVVWYCRNKEHAKYRALYSMLGEEVSDESYNCIEDNFGAWRRLSKGESSEPNARRFRTANITSQGASEVGSAPFEYQGKTYHPSKGNHWKPSRAGLNCLAKTGRLLGVGNTLTYKRYLNDFPIAYYNNIWMDTIESTFSVQKVYVVQTGIKVIERCVLMTTDPGDLVLDPTCGSGTTATVAEQWGRRWITIDTSRVALALARARIMGARYPYYLLADSRAGQQKEADLRGLAPSSTPTYGDLRHGFVYERVPHITLKSIANNAAIDVIWEQYQAEMEPLRAEINRLAGEAWEEWEVPRADNRDRIRDRNRKDEESITTTITTTNTMGEENRDRNRNRNRKDEESITTTNTNTNTITITADELIAQWWELRIARQRAIDAAIAAAADQEFLYDRPYQDRNTVRVAGPFTVESLSPHRVIAADDQRVPAVDADSELLFRDELRPLGGGSVFRDQRAGYAGDGPDFAAVILESLRAAGVQQAHKEGRITFTALNPWPGRAISAEGVYLEAETGIERRAGVFIGPEFGTVARPDLVAAAREAADAGFDVLIACAFNYDAHSSEFERLGRIPILKARMNADLHMAGALADTGAGNLFVIFGEPDIEIRDAPGGQIEVEIRGVDVFHPQSGEVRSSGPEGIACWFIDTAYNEESFFVRQAYFLGMNDPYGALKTTLKAEIDAEAWESL